MYQFFIQFVSFIKILPESKVAIHQIWRTTYLQVVISINSFLWIFVTHSFENWNKKCIKYICKSSTFQIKFCKNACWVIFKQSTSGKDIRKYYPTLYRQKLNENWSVSDFSTRHFYSIGAGTGESRVEMETVPSS